MKTITEQIQDLETENAQLREYKKLFEKAVKMEFGMDAKTIHQTLEFLTENRIYFIKKLSEFFALKTEEDYLLFVEIFCSEEYKKFHDENR